MTSRSPLLWLFVACMSLVLASPHSHAEQTFFKPGDVIALVGGEDMVAAAEYGYLETLITRALPDYNLKFRSLAWEGDTVFEQRRDLNYPSLEQQLEKIGATVVIAQFGQMESFAGKEKVPEFMAAYDKLMRRLENGGRRRVLVLTPCTFAQSSPLTKEEIEGRPLLATLPDWRQRFENLSEYSEAISKRGSTPGLPVPPGAWNVVELFDLGVDDVQLERDGLHLSDYGHLFLARNVVRSVLNVTIDVLTDTDGTQLEPLRKLIAAKNRLWFHYYRPQNWAFLAGDRTNQPSSRDHLDPSKRWFPEELEKFLPLIGQKETEIHQLAASLAKP
ncbi:hypothetical protein ACXR0O_00080 [Verrucomicrobiota bacterium sgz303538]